MTRTSFVAMACLAPPTDAAQAAAVALLGTDPAAAATALPDAGAALAAVGDGTCDVAVVPWEDSDDGSAVGTVDALVFDVADLVVCAETDQLRDGSSTRWVAVRPATAVEPPATDARVQTLLFAVPRHNRPGALTEILAAFSSRGINVARFEPRPLHAALGMYGFLLEVEGHPADAWLTDAMADLLSAASSVRHLGTWEAGGRAWSAVSGRQPAGATIHDRADLEALVTAWTPTPGRPMS